MSHIADPSDEEFGTALAAAAYAITLLAEEGSLNQRQPSEELTRYPTQTTSKKEDGIKKRSGTIKISRWLSGKDAREDWRPAGRRSRKKSTTLEERMREDIADKKMPEEATGTSTPTVRKTTFSDTYLNDTGIDDRRTQEKPIGSAPTMKKMPTLSDKYLNDTGSKRSEGEQDMREDIADRKMAEAVMGTTPTVKKTPTFSDKYLNDTDKDSRRPEMPIGKAPTMKKMPTFFDKYLNDAGNKRSEGEHDMQEDIADRKMVEKAMGATSTVKKTPTFSDKYLNDAGSERIEDGQDIGAGRQTEGLRYQNSIKPQKQETEADSWEIEEMAKIRKRHEKLNLKILEWENEKKRKARRRMERKERELEQRRVRLLREYRNEMLTIDKVAGGARAASNERKQKDELKAKEMAKKIRSTGKVPHTWFCI